MVGRVVNETRRLIVSKARDQERSLRRIAKRSQTLRAVAHQVLGRQRSIRMATSELRMNLGTRIMGPNRPGEVAGVEPANMVWIFGFGRSGSTWLRNMMGEMANHVVWDEPLVGRLFGDFYYNETVVDLPRAHFIMGDPTRRGWVRSIRHFVLSGAKYANPQLKTDNYLAIKEPNGSAGAPLLMEALPESRLILLIRDPKDVVASIMDGVRKGGWLHELGEKKDVWEHDLLAEERPDAYVRKQASRYLYEVTNAKKAYEAHKGRKVLVKYEDLRNHTLPTMRSLYSALEILVDDQELQRVVSAHSWDNIPKKDKGPGKFTRKATPGGWKEDLTPEQVHIVEEVTAPLLAEFHYPS